MKAQNVLLLGSGGREHVFAWKLAQSKWLNQLWIAPGNAGTSQHGKNISLNILDFPQIKDFVIKNDISLVVVGPEEPLVNGIVDFFLQDSLLNNVPIIGPSQKGAQLEGSKDYAKQFMHKYNIPTASHQSFNNYQIEEAIDFLHKLKAPYVIKADGLAAGKGVSICYDLDEAKKAIEEAFIHNKFGKAGSKVVIEEFLKGIELSVFIATDGNNYILLPEAKDYKRVGEGDTGPNTGGMGAISPVPFADAIFMQKVIDSIIEPTIKGLQKEQISYRGFIFIGIMNVQGNPYVIEYNVRMGDPETQVVFPRIYNDIIELFLAIYNKNINNIALDINKQYAATVILTSKGYPGAFEKGKKILFTNNNFDSIIFHAGTTLDSIDNTIITNGGRVMAITSMGSTLAEALEKSYQTEKNIVFENKYCRKDIGFEFI